MLLHKNTPQVSFFGFDHLLQLSLIFVPCALFFASIVGICWQLHIDTFLRDIKGLSGELSQGKYLVSWMGYFGTETIHSLFDRFSLSKWGSTLNLTRTLLTVYYNLRDTWQQSWEWKEYMASHDLSMPWKLSPTWKTEKKYVIRWRLKSTRELLLEWGEGSNITTSQRRNTDE